jgi:hypothetical protein
VRWRAQQARQGGDEDFLWSIVAAALESVELRRAGAGAPPGAAVDRRKLALTLEVLAENAACYGARRACSVGADQADNSRNIRGIRTTVSIRIALRAARRRLTVTPVYLRISQCLPKIGFEARPGALPEPLICSFPTASLPWSWDL